jgi:hypothetical protein
MASLSDRARKNEVDQLVGFPEVEPVQASRAQVTVCEVDFPNDPLEFVVPNQQREMLFVG